MSLHATGVWGGATRIAAGLWVVTLLAGLSACGSHVPMLTPTTPAAPAPGGTGAAAAVSAGPALLRGKSRWVPVAWNDLPGLDVDDPYPAWNAWLKSCERPSPVFAPLCPEVRQLSIAEPDAQRAWVRERLQPYRVEALDGTSGPGLLTAYFEPEFEARRQPGAGFNSPLYALPAGLKAGQPWYTRQEMDSLPQAQAALRARALLYLADPVDALLLQIQGSGRLRVTEPDGRMHWVRLAYAGHNGQPYQSVGRWLLERGELRDASWPGIRTWLAAHPQRVQELLWQNPRVVFFREQPLDDFEAGFGPRGAQGVPLTPGRSIAVDPDSIPFGTPVWLASEGASASLQRLVLAQDTGSAITGALRADYFVGWGAQAGELAGRFKQPLRLWVLWPKATQ